MLNKLKRLLFSKDVQTIDSKRTDEELRGIFHDLCEYDPSFAESNLKYVFMHSRFATGNEWLREIEYKLNLLLDERPEAIPPDIAGRMRAMISEIQNWFEYVERTSIRHHAQPQEPLPEPQTLKEWIRERR